MNHRGRPWYVRPFDALGGAKTGGGVVLGRPIKASHEGPFMREFVLVGDEDPFNLRLLEEVCDAGGYRVQTAGDGPELLHMISRERPDLLLVDVKLPKIDGFEVLRILKADAELRGIPVLLMTAIEDVRSRSRAIELGADDWLSKPYRVFEVQQRIRNALRASRGDQQAAKSSGNLSRAELATTLEYEFIRAQRYGHPLTLLRVAWAPSKPPLERRAESIVRAQLVEVVRPCLRASDQLFAASDYEIAVLLPETARKGASIVADRIRARITQAALWSHFSRDEPNFGVGLASTAEGAIKDASALFLAATPKE